VQGDRGDVCPANALRSSNGYDWEVDSAFAHLSAVSVSGNGDDIVAIDGMGRFWGSRGDDVWTRLTSPSAGLEVPSGGIVSTMRYGVVYVVEGRVLLGTFVRGEPAAPSPS
jgi:hypothetical protein